MLDQENKNRQQPRVYLDNAASTPVAHEVFESMIPFLEIHYGNPSSLHSFGREANRAIQGARRKVAERIGAKSKEIFFTSGGTEADNLAIRGGANAAKLIDLARNQVIVSSIEHDAILEPCSALEQEQGFEIIFLPVTRDGLVIPSNLENVVGERTALVSVMYANNEVGTIQPIKELASVAHKSGALFHTDAVQAYGKIPINVREIGVDMLSMSSHKINGPKGVGALYVRSGISIGAIIHGGGQEASIRSGTENVPGIVGFGTACELLRSKTGIEKTGELRDYLVDRVLSEIPNSRLNGAKESKLPGNAHFTFLGVNGEDLIIKLDEYGVAASTGSACSVNKQKSSHVLKAMGFSYEEISGSLRLSIGPQNTKDEVDYAIAALSRAVKELRTLSPFSAKYSNNLATSSKD